MICFLDYNELAGFIAKYLIHDNQKKYSFFALILLIRTSELKVKVLQLVALPNQLLLAVIPDRNSIRLRQMFWNDLMSPDWQSKVQERYPGNGSSEA